MKPRADSGSRSAVYASVPDLAVDLLDVVAGDRERYPFLLQSVATGPQAARFDILFAFPGETLTLHADGTLSGPGSLAGQHGFLESLDLWWQSEQPGGAIPDAIRESPFRGGWFLYLGYELAAEVEPGLELPLPAAELPVAFATRIPLAVVRDRNAGAMYVIAEAGSSHHIDTVLADLARASQQHDSDEGRSAAPAAICEAPQQAFLEIVGRAQEHIRAGDIFQANLARRWTARFTNEPDPLLLYRRLCRSNPAPFAGLVLHQDFVLLSSSPERLVRRRGQQVDTRPIAGTRARSENAGDLQGHMAELLAHPKERAEHVMLIDLERNDLGRVCEGGSVTVSEYMVIESYAHVHHIVSNVTGRLRSGITPGELIRAVFPGGTITGCPKVRCMELIAELEGEARGAYTGSIGYLDMSGDCDLNILIRSMTLQGNSLEFMAGSGIVADSDPERELDETRAKAKGLLLSLQADWAEST